MSKKELGIRQKGGSWFERSVHNKFNGQRKSAIVSFTSIKRMSLNLIPL